MGWNLRGKSCLITGASSGIGFHAAVSLAERGARLILLARDARRGEHVRAEVAKVGREEPRLLLADLSDQSELRRVAEQVRAECAELHVLIHNAGLVMSERELSADGIEVTLATNHLAPFLLTELLRPLLQRSAPARIVVVASRAHEKARLDLADLQMERRFDGWKAYCNSKLCNVLFTYELARLLEGTQVTVNCLNPGVVATNLGANTHGPIRWFYRVARPFMISASEGAKPLVRLAADPELEGLSGAYFDREHRSTSSRESYDREAARVLWEASEKLTRLLD